MRVLELIQRLQDMTNKLGDVEVRTQISNHPDTKKLHVTGPVNSATSLSFIYINAEGNEGDS